MRLVQSWEGLRKRFATVDSSGVGLTDLAEVISPVLVVGYETADQHKLLLGGTQILAGPAAFAWAGIETEGDCWVEQISTYGSDPAIGFALGLTDDVLTPGVVASDAWLETPSSIRFLRAPPGGSPILPAPISSVNASQVVPWAMKFERPGLLVRGGKTLVIQTNQVAALLRLDMAVREAD